MTAKEFIEKVKKLANYIEKHPDLELADFTVGEPTPEEDIQKAINAGVKDESVLDFYRQTSSLVLLWNVEEEVALERYGIEALYLSQGFGFLPLSSVIDTEYWKDFVWTEENPEHKPLHPFNVPSESAGDAFYIEEGKSYDKLDIYSVVFEIKAYKLPLNFSEYLDKLYQTKGFWYWQTMFTNEPDEETRLIIENNVLSELFEDFNPDYYKI